MLQAITSCQEGQRAAERMRSKWAPSLHALETCEAAIRSQREAMERDSKVRHGIWPFRHAMTAQRKAVFSHEIDVKAGAVARDRERYRAQAESEQVRIVNNIAQRMKPVLERYAKEQGYSLILESGSKETPVMLTLVDITAAIVRLYDEAHPVEQ